jgi:hypothetical protein
MAVLAVLVLCGCSANIAQGPPPTLAVRAPSPVPLRFIVDGSFAADVEKTVDWLVAGNTFVQRALDDRAVADVYLTTHGQARWAGDCTVQVRALDRQGRLIIEGNKIHYCGWPGPHGDGVRAATVWAIEETVRGLSRGPVAAVASGAGSPALLELGAEAPQPPLGRMVRRDAVALVIGIDAYSEGLPPATGAVADAQLFAAFAQRTLGVPPEGIELLIGSSATKSAIEARLKEWLPRNASPRGDLFFYFAGHGAPDPVSGRRYLVPWDGNPQYIATQGIAVEDLVARLGKIPAAHVVAFLDACFSGGGGRSVLAPGTRPVVIESRAARRPPQGVVVFAATGPRETTGAYRGHGLFSYQLLRGLSGAADANGDRVITLGELTRFTHSSVATEARRQNRDQHPLAVGGRDDLVLTRLSP